MSRLTEYSFLALAAKKASKFVLGQNWFADPLEVHSQLASFDTLIRSISGEFQSENDLTYDIRRIAVPKSSVDGKIRKRAGRIHKSRELAHLPFRAQVASAAILMMLGDEWDAKLGPLDGAAKAVLGNRLDCYSEGSHRKFRLGTKTTYRFWADDYSQFVSLTSRSFNQSLENLSGKRRICLVSTDFSNFYPSIDLQRLNKLLAGSKSVSEVEREHIKRFLTAIEKGMGEAGLSGLPQGMVASGFLSNVYLSTFDEEVSTAFETQGSIKYKSPKLHFYSRYVDDIRIVVSYDPPMSPPIKDVSKHPAFLALNKIVSKHGLVASLDKTHVLDIDRNGARLTEGLLAEHMEDLAVRSYGALVPSQSEAIAKHFELLFSIDSTAERKPTGRKVQRNKYNPVIDGPGVRPDSRRRFAAGRFRKIFQTYRDCSDELEAIRRRFVNEIFREWKTDPSQIRLLYYAFDLCDYRDAMVKESLEFIKEYCSEPSNFEAGKWLPFIKAAIIRTFIDRAAKTDKCPTVIRRLGLESAKVGESWFLRVLGFILLACYRIPADLSEYGPGDDTQVQKAYDFWQFCMNPTLAEVGRIRTLTAVAKSIPVSRATFAYIVESVVENLDSSAVVKGIVVENVREISRIRKLKIKNAEAKAVAVNLGLIPGRKQRLSKKPHNPRVRTSLLSAIVSGHYRDPIQCAELMLKVVKRLTITESEILGVQGRINPFNFTFRKAMANFLEFTPALSLAGWVGPDWSQVAWVPPAHRGRSWGWPLGLLMRICLTANRHLVYGASPSHRYNLYMNQSRLCKENGFAPAGLVSIMTRLLAWPGALIKPYSSLGELEHDLRTVINETEDLSTGGGVRLLDSSVPVDGAGKLTLLTCQVFNGLPKHLMLTDETRSRKMVLYALSEVEHRIQSTLKMVQDPTTSRAFYVVAFPEFSVPIKAVGDIYRFVKKHRVSVLFGAWPEADSRGSMRNSLYWVFPGQDSTGSVDVQAIRQDKIYPTDAEINAFGIKPAEPKIIWRIPLRSNCRLAAINCYELTNLEIKALLSGRVEVVNTIAFNEDVSLFDGQAKSFSYDLYGYVSIVNSGLKGGSCVYAPYKGEDHRKQRLHLHGERQALVPLVELNVENFKVPKVEIAKTPPAGFKKR